MNHFKDVIDFISSLDGKKTQQIPNAYIKKSASYEFVLNHEAFKNKEVGMKLANVLQSLMICIKILEQGIQQLPGFSSDYATSIKQYHTWDDSIPISWINKLNNDLDYNNNSDINYFKEEIKVHYTEQVARLEKIKTDAPSVIKKTNKLYFSFIENTFIKSLNSTIFIHNHFKQNVLSSLDNDTDKKTLEAWEELFNLFETILQEFLKNKLDINQLKITRGDTLNFDIHKPYEEAIEEKGLDKDKIIEIVNHGYEYVKGNKTIIIKRADVVVSK
jgi:hypothetical protein